jgi:hypothetical protein
MFFHRLAGATCAVRLTPACHRYPGRPNDLGRDDWYGHLVSHYPRCYPSGMGKDELIIQLLKIALGVALGAYFLWWSLEVLDRLPPH